MYGGSYVQPPPSRPSQPPPQAAPSAATTRSVPLEKVLPLTENKQHAGTPLLTLLADNASKVDVLVVELLSLALAACPCIVTPYVQSDFLIR
jgi:hypothetical protein